MASSQVQPLCDVIGCTDDILCWVDGIAHCTRHLEDVWDRWQAFDIYPAMREHIDPIRYRQSPGKTDYQKSVERLQNQQRVRDKSK